MTPVRELRNQWRVWLNGLIHALWAALGSALGSAMLLLPMQEFGWITDKTKWVSIGAAVASGVINGVAGYLRHSPLPDVFAVNPDTGQLESSTKVLRENPDTGDLVATQKESL